MLRPNALRQSALDFGERFSVNSFSHMISTYKIRGMTCKSCEKKVTEKLLSHPKVISVEVSLENGTAEISSHLEIKLEEVKKALESLPQYTVTDEKTVPTQKPLLKTYQPLFILFSLILMISTAHQSRLPSWNAHLFMNHVMAGFFIGLSFFKFLDLKAFSESFSGYDPISRKWPVYGLLYPFVELTLGLLFVSGRALPLANAATILILSITTFGIQKKLRSKAQLQCACLGTTFNLPLSKITLIENAAMILMAALSLCV